MSNLSGLDMRKTIDWYASQEDKIRTLLPAQRAELFPYPLQERLLVGLTQGMLVKLMNLYPEQARQRFALRQVVGQQPNWFSEDSLKEGRPIPTTDPGKAISSTAIIPSYITPWVDAEKDKRHDIWLYTIRKEDVPSLVVRKIILSEGFVHELAHTLVNPALYYKGYELILPNGEKVDGLEFVLKTFGELAEQRPPISHYASSYRNANGKFDTEIHGYITPVNEELCECIAAYLLRFVFCEDHGRRFSPFADRPQIGSFVSNFLHATAVE